MAWTLETTDEFAHWYDPTLAAAWLARVRELLAREPQLNGAPYAAQLDNVRDTWRAIANLYRAFNVSPHGDHAYRALWAEWIGRPGLNVPVQPSFWPGEGAYASANDLVWRVWEDPHEVSGAPGEPPLMVGGVGARYTVDAVAMFRRIVDANWRGRADVVIRAGILDEVGNPLFGCLEAPPGAGERCSWESQHWPSISRYSWDSIGAGGRGIFQTLRILPPLRWSVTMARQLVARFSGTIARTHRELVLSSLVENVRHALAHSTSYRGLQELAALWPAGYDASRAGFGDALGRSVALAAAPLTLANPVVGGIVSGAGRLLGQILEGLRVPMASGWNSDAFGYPTPRLIPAVVSTTPGAQNRPSHTVPPPFQLGPLPGQGLFVSPYASTMTEFSLGAGQYVNVATPAQLAAVQQELANAPPPADAGDEWHPVDDVPAVRPVQEPPGVSTATKVAAGGAVGLALLYALAKRR